MLIWFNAALHEERLKLSEEAMQIEACNGSYRCGKTVPKSGLELPCNMPQTCALSQDRKQSGFVNPERKRCVPAEDWTLGLKGTNVAERASQLRQIGFETQQSWRTLSLLFPDFHFGELLFLIYLTHKHHYRALTSASTLWILRLWMFAQTHTWVMACNWV